MEAAQVVGENSAERGDPGKPDADRADLAEHRLAGDVKRPVCLVERTPCLGVQQMTGLGERVLRK